LSFLYLDNNISQFGERTIWPVGGGYKSGLFIYTISNSRAIRSYG